MSDLDWNDSPVCPHCGKEVRDFWELMLDDDGASTEIDCDYCDKPMKVTMCLDVTYSTAKVEAPHEHD